MKENQRKCVLCDASPAQDPETKLFRFPKPGPTNITRCERWAKYCFPEKPWINRDFQRKLYLEHRMLCHRHFKKTSFVDLSSKSLRRFAYPDFETVTLPALQIECLREPVAGPSLTLRDITDGKQSDGSHNGTDLQSNENMEPKQESIFEKFKWLNQPKTWKIENNVLEVTTDENTDFWQGTWYNFHFNTGHVFGINLVDDFAITACIESDFKELYDQAGLMLYLDETHWIKSGIEYNEGSPMISSVYTNQVSDWATGIFPGDANKFFLRISKVNKVVCIKYSVDSITWTLLRLCEFPLGEIYFVGLMCCTPKRGGLVVRFSDIKLTEPEKDILHSN